MKFASHLPNWCSCVKVVPLFSYMSDSLCSFFTCARYAVYPSCAGWTFAADNAQQWVMPTLQSRYTGEIKNGKRSGTGTMLFKDGAKYTGEWCDDVPTGTGVFDRIDQQITCMWDRCVPCGECVTQFPDRTMYQTWTDGKVEDRVKIVFNDGRLYEGDYTNGHYCGEGQMTYASGNVYRGSWRGSVETGYGVMQYYTRDVYDGQWLHGQRSGYGIYRQYQGTTYSGEWRYDFRHGHGKELDQHNRVVRQGEWRKGQLITGITTVYDDTNNTIMRFDEERNLITGMDEIARLNDKMGVFAEKIDALEQICAAKNTAT